MKQYLARLRRNGPLERCPHNDTYRLTADGQRVALFYSRGSSRLLLLRAADKAPTGTLLQALATIDRQINGHTDTARMKNTA